MGGGLGRKWGNKDIMVDARPENRWEMRARGWMMNTACHDGEEVVERVGFRSTHHLAWYTVTELMFHAAVSKLEPFMTCSGPVPGHPELPYAAPAQSPKRVMSNVMACCTKWLAVGQVDAPHAALRNLLSHPEGDGFWEVMSCGIEARGKFQILIPSSVQSMAKTAPPASFNGFP